VIVAVNAISLRRLRLADEPGEPPVDSQPSARPLAAPAARPS
jgi:hypothetical protein